MGNVQLQFLLAFVCVLFLPTTEGTYEQCLTALRNTVVYEGTQNTMMTCAAGFNDVAWSIRPTSKAIEIYQITDFTGVVDSTLTGLYTVDKKGLMVLNATVDKTGSPISTAGVVIVNFANDTKKIAAKLIVIRSGPICSSSQSASSKVSILSCTMVYADHPVFPISAVMNWTVNGQFYRKSQPTRTIIYPYVWNSTSTITVSNSNSSTYDCTVTFAASIFPRSPSLVKNSPDFSATCRGGNTQKI